MPNILFIGGGRRVELANLFIQEGCKVFAYELDSKVPIADVAKEVVLGLPAENSFFEQHLGLVIEKHNIDVAIPLMDDILHALRDNYNKKILKSTRDGLILACSKKSLADYCSTRKWYPHPEIGQPAIAKPNNGYGSNGIICIDNYDGKTIPANCIIQKRIFGKEYTVDAYFDKSNIFRAISSRLRIKVAGGEVIESETSSFRRDYFENIIKNHFDRTLFSGPICFQFIMTDSGDPYLIEINARFGGGSTLSCRAGVPMHKYIIEEYILNQKLSNYSTIKAREGVYLNRSYRDHIYEKKTGN